MDWPQFKDTTKTVPNRIDSIRAMAASLGYTCLPKNLERLPLAQLELLHRNMATYYRNRFRNTFDK